MVFNLPVWKKTGRKFFNLQLPIHPSIKKMRCSCQHFSYCLSVSTFSLFSLSSSLLPISFCYLLKVWKATPTREIASAVRSYHEGEKKMFFLKKKQKNCFASKVSTIKRLPCCAHNEKNITALIQLNRNSNN